MDKSLNNVHQWTDIKKNLKDSDCAVTILSSFTANPIEPYLGTKLYNYGIGSRITFGLYNQIVQQCRDLGSIIYSEKTKITIIWPRLEDIISREAVATPTGSAQFLKDTDDLLHAVLYAAENIKGKLLFILPQQYGILPAGAGDMQTAQGMAALSLEARRRMIRSLAGKENILLCDCEEAVKRVGVRNAFAPELYAFAKVPFTNPLFEEIAGMIADCLYMAEQTDPYILVFDAAMLVCDDYSHSEEAGKSDNLTERPIAEDDLSYMFQQYLNDFAGWGGKLLLCTSSDENTMQSVLAQSKVVLSYDKASYICCDSTNIFTSIKSIAKQHQIEQNRFVLVTTRTAEANSSISVLQLPADNGKWQEILENSHYTNHFVEGASDAIPLSETLETVGDFDYFSNLMLIVNLERANKDQIQQVDDILHNVNDFRFSNFKCSMEEIERMLEHTEYQVMLIYVKDRFGDYGAAGLSVSCVKEDCFYIKDYILNCRVLGKRTEYYVMNDLSEMAQGLSCNKMAVSYSDNGFNDQALPFLSEITGKDEQEIKKGEEILIDILSVRERMKQILNTKTEQKAIAPSDVSKEYTKQGNELIGEAWKRKSKLTQNNILNGVTDISTFYDIMRELNSSFRRTGTTLESEYVEPRNETESILAELWSEILHVERVGVLDNFFHLGGTSILATQLIVRFQEIFDILLPIRVFFDRSNIEQLAMYINALKVEEDRKEINDSARRNYRYKMREFLKSEIWLDENITAKGMKEAIDVAQCKNVFLTGSTGFMGAFVVRDLIEDSGYDLTCLIRAKDEAEGMERLIKNMKDYGIWKDSYAERLHILCGDLSKPLLGLSINTFEETAEAMDMIYHCAANTNFLEPYQRLKESNVLGTQEILRLAVTKKLKMVHYVSSTYVFSTLSNPEGTVIYEDDVPTNNEILIMGYQQTKLICEQMVAIARSRGIPISVYRPGRISGSSIDGACQLHDFIWLMIKCCIEAGLVFEEVESIELIPVDYISKAFVNISLKEQAVNRNFHLITKTRPEMKTIFQWMEKRGFYAKYLPYFEWRDELIRKVAENPELDSIKAIIPFLTDDMTGLKETLFLDTKNTDEVLSDCNIDRIEVDEEIFNKYLDYFIDIDFLNIPKVGEPV